LRAGVNIPVEVNLHRGILAQCGAQTAAGGCRQRLTRLGVKL
jgi:hypothetical protein